MRFKILISFILLWLFVSGLRPCFAQEDSTSQYLMASAGLNVNSFYSLGFRLFFEYQKDLTPHWQWGVSYETTRHLTTSMAGLPRDAHTLEVSHQILSGNIYRKVNLPADWVHWRFGAGLGLMHAYWNQNDRVGLAVNLSAGLHFRLSPNAWLTTSAFPVLLPSNRMSYSYIQIDGFSILFSGSLLNLGFQVRL